MGSKPKIELASQEQVNKYERGQAIFLLLIGVKGALVTDLSQVSDFSVDEPQLLMLSSFADRQVVPADKCWEVFRDLEKEEIRWRSTNSDLLGG